MDSDFHIHTSFSADSESSMADMAEEGIRRGLKRMCFTEHLDYHNPVEPKSFIVDTEAYLAELKRCREAYAGQIELLFGIELGLHPPLAERLTDYVQKWDFDFIIGSSHVVGSRDPYFPSFFEGRTEEEAYREYFHSIKENLEAFSDLDVYGHLDYVVRYGPNRNLFYSYEKYQDVLDEALLSLISHGVGLELNTAGFKYGLGHAHPHPDVLKRYRELGGEIITVGSDAHKPEHLAYDFHKVKDILEACGFRYYTVFRGRKPEFIRL